tara:strand:+ start:5025 stop:5918 length:894 start_codon:yes stop_codon:yes gene_type:complete
MKFGNSIRYIIGILLLVTAILKAYELSTSPITVEGYFSSRVFLTGFVLFELAFGLVLLSGVWLRQTWKATFALFGLFAGISLYKGLAGFESCGCFGRFEVDPWWTFTMDVVVLTVLLRWKSHWEKFIPAANCRLRIVAVFFVLIGGTAGYFMASYTPTVMNEKGVIVGDGSFVVLQPEKWVGQPLPIGSAIDVFEQLKHDQCILLLYHHDCSKCQEVLPLYEEIAAKKLSNISTIALIEVPPYGKLHRHLTNSLLHGRLSDEKDWFVKTPTEIVLEDGIVTKISVDSELMSLSSEVP